MEITWMADVKLLVYLNKWQNKATGQLLRKVRSIPMNSRSTIELIVSAFELAGVVALIIGAIFTFIKYIGTLLKRRAGAATAYSQLREGLGRAILIGLEFLVAADIIRSVAIDPTFTSVGVLGLLVVVRTFLSWSLEVEITGRWPWQPATTPTTPPAEF